MNAILLTIKTPGLHFIVVRLCNIYAQKLA